MSGVTPASRDLKKLLGNPKIIFVLGGPASGKGTQCAKLVEEFGFTHISSGDLFRDELKKNTKDGQAIKKIMDEGGLVPFELTCNILINALIANPSKNYLLDGFPRALDQAVYFEKNVVEANQILFYDVPQEKMLERCMKRAETSGRSDDNAETIKARVQNYFDQSLPVVNYYKQFGKVKHMDATGDIASVYAQSKAAVLPQCMFVLGAKASGKTTIGTSMAARTNMKLIDFNDYLKKNGLTGQDDETVTASLIQSLVQETIPRIVLENFPQNVKQAKYFLRNGTTPSHVFSLNCLKDMCQERMLELGEANPGYVPSSILSKKIKKYHDDSKELLPFLAESTNLVDVNTDQALDKSMEEVYRNIEPLVIHVRPGAGGGNELRREIVEKLSAEHGFVNLDVDKIQRGENERGTNVGKELQRLVEQSKVVPAETTVRMLNKIIYAGQPSQDKFILSSFPDIIDQAQEFEKNCSKIAAMIYPSSQGATVEIKGNNLTLHNIDSLFAKNFKLKTMNEWSYQLFDEKLGNKTHFGVLVGKSLSGKTTIAKKLESTLGSRVLDMNAIAAAVGARMTPEGEDPVPVPIEAVEKEVASIIAAAQGGPGKAKFVFDGYMHETEEAFIAFIAQFGLPEFVFFLTAEEKYIKERWVKVKMDGEGEVGEEDAEKIRADSAVNEGRRAKLTAHFEQFPGRVNLIQQNTGTSLESTLKELNAKFSPKVILVNHQKRLAVDTPCANLAIKYNMIYISAYQVIREHVQNNTAWGKKLVAGKKSKAIDQSLQVRDEFNEAEFSPVHFDIVSVMQLLKETISDKRTNQKFVLLEGLCNSQKLSALDDQLELRFMDELFQIEATVGEVAAIIGLQFQEEPEFLSDDQIEYEKFPEPAAEEAKQAPADGEEEAEEPPAEDAGEGEAKAPEFKKEDYQWTVSDRKAKNLPQLYLGCKGINTLHEVKQATDFDAVQGKAIAKCLDDFCGRLQDSDNSDKYQYQQVIFK